ncbi:ABC transporter substrate-binding protein [Paenibacillus sp. NEAU-GSW1]|uniref:ABC transporter substrate-binding protein n=1 Tax=Paenibacillus sp. NEAU-GSW1 TaxID=2682486 RepID=UPI0012E2D1FA|nr:iron-siderophore ABC transporter substrate-binding protein [Paenibacillus sp. NEAU-GSW1]MUT67215.1 ABC transporter substrate-binding protein [Paenibacillus sp. NEAU-GSW1]
MKGLKGLVILLLAIVVISGCGANGANKEGSNNGGKEQAAAETASPETNAATGGAKTITHSMGTATLEKTPERVVVLFNGMVDISVALGIKPVGAVESWDEKPFYVYLRDKMEGVETLGEENQPNVEAIVALKPDVIIGSKLRHEKIYPQLNAIAPTIMMEDVFSWKDNLTMAGEILDKQDEAAAILADWDKRAEEFRTKMGDKLGSTEVSIIRFEEDGTSRFYVTGFAGTIFKELGLGRPEAQQVPDKTVVNVTTKEQIPLLGGDYIFDLTMERDGEEGKKTQKDWTSNPLWTNLDGVKNGQYHHVNAITWNLGGGPLAAKMMMDDLFTYMKLN